MTLHTMKVKRRTQYEKRNEAGEARGLCLHCAKISIGALGADKPRVSHQLGKNFSAASNDPRVSLINLPSVKQSAPMRKKEENQVVVFERIYGYRDFRFIAVP